jgi:hypothetical protein
MSNQPVYLIDFSVYKPPEELRVDREQAEEHGKHWSVSNPEHSSTVARSCTLYYLSPCTRGLSKNT